MPPPLVGTQALAAATVWAKWVLASQEQPFHEDSEGAVGIARNDKGIWAEHHGSAAAP